MANVLIPALGIYVPQCRHQNIVNNKDSSIRADQLEKQTKAKYDDKFIIRLGQDRRSKCFNFYCTPCATLIQTQFKIEMDPKSSEARTNR